jgi:hypothetical protein
MNIPRIETKFTFNNGGHSDFQAKFEWLKNRLHHAQEMGIIPGQNVEPPPPYDLEPGPSSGAHTAQAATGERYVDKHNGPAAAASATSAGPR